MKEKLLSILKNRRDEKGFTLKTRSGASEKFQKGFTLIELLVVIAIIAILVVIVVVAINPVQRLNDATDRTADSNVRSTGTLIGVCITEALSVTGGDLDDCDDDTKVAALGDGNVPADVTVIVDVVTTPTTNICAFQVKTGTNQWSLYQSGTGEVATITNVGSPTCPVI